MTVHDDTPKALLMRRYARLVGSEPVGLADTLSVLTHPDLIEFTWAWLEGAYATLEVTDDCA